MLSIFESEKEASATRQRMYHRGLTGMHIFMKIAKYLGQPSHHRNIVRAPTKETEN
jgi:hypothetical protein